MANGMPQNVYLIRQNIEHLYGEYLVTAVVIAPGPGRAVKDLLRHVRFQRPAAIARRCRLNVVRIGENARVPLNLHDVNRPDGEATTVAVVFGEDDR